MLDLDDNVCWVAYSYGMDWFEQSGGISGVSWSMFGRDRIRSLTSVTSADVNWILGATNGAL